MSDMPKVSVIVPMYNPGQMIQRGLNSLRNQTLRDIEIILVDDCSDESTLTEAKAAASEETRIRVLKTEVNSGPGIARNIGIDNAVGEYLAFMDADDFLAPECLEILYDTAQKYQADIAQCQMDHRTSKDSITDTTDGGIDVYTREEALLAYNRTIDGPRCMSAGKLYRREVFKGIEYPHDGRTNEFRVYYIGNKVASICRNSLQDFYTPEPPAKLVEKYSDLPSIFYTVDYAELEDGSWKIIEAGDGSVSGLSDKQDHKAFFRSLYQCLN